MNNQFENLIKKFNNLEGENVNLKKHLEEINKQYNNLKQTKIINSDSFIKLEQINNKLQTDLQNEQADKNQLGKDLNQYQEWLMTSIKLIKL